jgi:hypothetical protein
MQVDQRNVNWKEPNEKFKDNERNQTVFYNVDSKTKREIEN